ncbi:CBS domain-containing protein [Prauserella marina]|uniref:CBS domain-containing protein n=2 Tax=Prauserella marina TaxID=530584 RepID=A0A1G6VZA8_9PSEU|nr:CBS domain protein [Prauserella marina]SDD58156.1 CBS domain-containing protein [Prauserella marina]
MSRPVVTVTEETTVKEAARLLSEHGFTSLPVVAGDERLTGIVTEADLLRDQIPPGVRGGRPAVRQVPPTTVGEVMTSPASSRSRKADIAELVSVLLTEGFHAMPIVDSQRVVGIVTRRDVVRALSRDDTTIARDVRRRLMIYGGADRWTVAVRDGVASIVDEYDDAADRHVATLLAESVPGVTSATTIHRPAD